nr:immunoglobulin heavy chain junction region [Macaca mulatta]
CARQTPVADYWYFEIW